MQNNRKRSVAMVALLLGMVLALVPTPVYATNKKTNGEEVVAEETISISTRIRK